MEKPALFRDLDLPDKLKALYTAHLNDITELVRENRKLSADLMLIKRESRIFERLLLVSMSANALILGIVL